MHGVTDVPRVPPTGKKLAGMADLQSFISDAASNSTAIVAKVGHRRGTKNKNRQHLMGLKVSLMAGDDESKPLIASRCVCNVLLEFLVCSSLLTSRAFFVVASGL